QTPNINQNAVVLTSTEGTVFVVDKYTGETVTRFKTEGSIGAMVAYNKALVYIPGEDYFLYAYDTAKGQLLYRFPGQSPILQHPSVTDKDVFVTPAKAGMFRLDRLSGEPRWNNKEAIKFLASNQRFVYVFDKFDRMLVLD